MSDISKRILETITCKDISYGDLSDTDEQAALALRVLKSILEDAE